MCNRYKNLNEKCPDLTLTFLELRSFSTLIEIGPLHDDLGGCRISPNYTKNGHPKGDAISRDVKISLSLGMDLDLAITGFNKQVRGILNNF